MLAHRDDSMKAAVYDRCGPGSVLSYRDVAVPELSPIGVRIQVQAISIEGGDLRRRRSVPPPTPNFVVGYQAAGVIDAVGNEVRNLRVGDRVAAFHWSGSHAEYFVVPQDFVYPVPAGLDIKRAATVPVTFGTAEDALFEIGDLQSGETVLVHGATGGVGLAIIQVAASAGARVVATASRHESYAQLVALGASELVNHAHENVASRVREVTGERGVDLVVDLAGGSAAKELLTVLRHRGRMCLVGAASGVEPTFAFRDLVPRGLSVRGVAFGREMHTDRVRTMVQKHFACVADGQYQVAIAAEFSLSQAAHAHEFAETGRPFGRVMMVP